MTDYLFNFQHRIITKNRYVKRAVQARVCTVNVPPHPPMAIVIMMLMMMNKIFGVWILRVVVGSEV